LPLSSRIDAHQHILPPAYRAWLEDRGYFGGKRNPEWSLEAALAAMEQMDIEAAVVSVSRPGVYVPAETGETVRMARLVNEFCGELKRDHPRRFGFYAQLPLPDVDASFVELAYAFDVLGADGVILHTRVADQYVGCEAWDPVMEELDLRGACVLIHPTNPVVEPLEDVPHGACDFLLDTTRAAVNLVRKGAVRRFPRLRVILSHGGGFVPYAAERLATLTPTQGDWAPADADAFVADLRSLYFDTALASSRYSLPTLLAFAQPDRLLFGSDWPHAARDGRRDLRFTESLDAYTPIDESARAAINGGNALELFPQFAPAGVDGAG
jgi:predicted TIM-barrel fold metal-dependent hydrolase